MKIDIGCGHHPSGDVNCDLFIRDIGHRGEKKLINLDAKKIKNFLVCDAQYLPFRDSVFDEVYSHHVIEHLRNPYLFLKETIRISKDKVIIICPHRYGDRVINLFHGKWNNTFHLHYLNKKWFFEQLKNYLVGYDIKYTRFVYLPFFPFCLFCLPLEMKIKIWKHSYEKN